MLIPYRRYAVWYLLAETSDAQFAKHLDDISLPDPEHDGLAELRRLLEDMPLSSGMRKRLSKKAPWDAQTSSYLGKLGMGEIYDVTYQRPDLDHHLAEQWGKCWALIKNPVARVAIECALMTGMSFEEVAGSASQMAGTQLTPEMLALYERYFFDHRAMSKADFREYLRMVSANAYVYVRYMKALTCPRDEVLHFIGLPTKTQLGVFLNRVLTTASYKFQTYSDRQDPEANILAMKWAKVGIEAGIRAEKFAASDVRDFANAVQAEFDYVDQAVDTITPEMLANVKPSTGTGAEGSPAPVPPPAVFEEHEV